MRREKRVTVLPPTILDGISDSTNFDHVTHAALCLVQKETKVDWKRKKHTKQQTRILKVMGIYT
jgi:hypothetical protein